MRLLNRLVGALFPQPEPPLNSKGGRLRQIVARVAHSPVHGMEIVAGHWWAHTAHGYHPVQHYLELAHEQKKECCDAPESA